MCNYMGHRVSYNDYIRLKQLEKQASVIEGPKPYQTGFDYLDWPVIRPTANGEWEVDKMEWGYLPNYVFTRADVDKFRRGYKDTSGNFIKGRTTLNAKGEELFIDRETGKAKIWADSALNRRCLVIASNFYEWRHLPVMGKRGKILATPERFPYYIKVDNPEYSFIIPNNPHFVMPGVWNRWEDRNTHEIVDTFALTTTAANSKMKQIHNTQKRMPAILTYDLAMEWISEGLSEERITQIATNQILSKDMAAWTIPKKFQDLPDPSVKYDYDGMVPPLIDMPDSIAA